MISDDSYMKEYAMTSMVPVDITHRRPIPSRISEWRLCAAAGGPDGDARSIGVDGPPPPPSSSFGHTAVACQDCHCTLLSAHIRMPKQLGRPMHAMCSLSKLTRADAALQRQLGRIGSLLPPRHSSLLDPRLRHFDLCAGDGVVPGYLGFMRPSTVPCV